MMSPADVRAFDPRPLAGRTRRAARRARLIRGGVALAATLLAAACVRTRREPVPGRVAVDVHSPLQKGTVWDATLTG